jgi:hypothetical protein
MFIKQLTWNFSTLSFGIRVIVDSLNEFGGEEAVDIT